MIKSQVYSKKKKKEEGNEKDDDHTYRDEFGVRPGKPY